MTTVKFKSIATWNQDKALSADTFFYIGHDEMALTFLIEICYEYLLYHIYRKRAWNGV